MTNDISFDVGAAVPYLVESIKAWFGKDALSEGSKDLFEGIFRLSCKSSSHIQCVGMSKPIPIEKIFQKTELSDSPYTENNNTDIRDIIESSMNAIIYAGPGDGKTTLMHWLFRYILKSPQYLPILITLRWPNAIQNLQQVVLNLNANRIPSAVKNKKILLLVDGYDEVAIEERKYVSCALRNFASLEVGNFLLTSRNNYDIIDLPANCYWITKFKANHAVGFCSSFFKAYQVELNAHQLLKELRAKGFDSFTEHPLMLTLVCILQTTSLSGLPRSGLGLIRRAIDTLTLRWDESKGIARYSTIPLDGEERVRCMMRIAYHLNKLIGSERQILQVTKEHLHRQQIVSVNPKKLLQELAQWYGLLVPASSEEWCFVHRTIHDFLAARYWVESGEFGTNKVKDWNVRSAYAMSIVPDATLYLKQALHDRCEIHVLIQCLINNATFDTEIIAKAIVQYINDVNLVSLHDTEGFISGQIKPNNDFFIHAQIPLLEALIYLSMQNKNKDIGKAVILYCLFEFFQRKAPTPNWIVDSMLITNKKPQRPLSVYKAGRIVEFNINQLNRKGHPEYAPR